MTKKQLWIFFFWAPLLAICLAGVKIFYNIEVWKYNGPQVEFKIHPGESFGSINHRLNKLELISNPRIFHRYSQANGVMTKFKSGIYKIPSGTNMSMLINIFIEGKSLTVGVTIPEGKNLFEIAKILAAQKVTPEKEFIEVAKDPSFMKELEIPAQRVEGYLYPETYHFTPGTSAKQVIKIMVREFRNATKDLDFSQSTMSKHEVVTLASVVEKETGASWERPRIAGVFLNRLTRKRPMRLQSDPTIIYGIYEEFDGNLRKSHIRQKTPYNTYRINGLPKGPISNPGKASIQAVLEPEDHRFLYFVSQNDGTHVFSETLEKHNQAVDTYQRNRKNRVGKSWRNLKDK